MTEERKRELKSWVERLKYRQYSTGVMHVVAPQWLEDIRDLIKCCEELFRELK